jgi:serralysin
MCVLCPSRRLRAAANDLGFQSTPFAWSGPVASASVGVESVAPTRVLTVDGLLSGVKWASTSLTYSFPTSASAYGYSGEAQNGFEGMSTIQQAAIVKALGMFSSVTGLTFSQAASDATGTLRFAQSNEPSTAWAYYPAAEEQGGDVWFGRSSGWYTQPSVGTYGFHTILHELGHALGLKHGHETAGAFRALPGSVNSMPFTVMSYASFTGASLTAGYTNEATGYAQTLMMQDIAALQRLYGANFTHNAGDTVYRWNPATGEMSIDGVGQGAPAGNRIFATVWDGNGVDTYDLSAYASNVSINLSPGAWSTFSTGLLARLDFSGSRVAPGNVANALQFERDARSLIENAVGGSGNDRIIGNVADNRLTGNAGNDSLVGGSGHDTLIGGNGRDHLTGGEGSDIFRLDRTFETGRTLTTRDVIADFLQGTDRIDLSRIDANTRVAADQAFTFDEATLARLTAPGQLVFRHEVIGGVEHTLVSGNVDTNLAADFEFALLGRYDLRATDFVL